MSVPCYRAEDLRCRGWLTIDGCRAAILDTEYEPIPCRSALWIEFDAPFPGLHP